MNSAVLRFLIPAVLLGVAAGCSKKPDAAGGQGGKGGPVPVNVGEALKKDMPLDLRAIGNVESMATVEVKAQVGGELLEVNFKEGQDVKKGDLLFTIQPLLYETLLAQAEANLVKDRVQAENLRRAAERNLALGTKGAISPEQLDQMRAAAEAAEATVKADEALVKIARVRLGYSTIESPIAGRTGAVSVQPGNLIKDNADTAMTTIKQMAPIYVTFAVPEQHLAEIRRGLAERPLPVTALDPKDGHALAQGTVTFIANAVDMSTGTITLKATFPNDDRALWPGAFVDVVLRLDTERGVTVVPASAVTMGQKGPQVFVIKADGSADLRSVAVGRTVGRESIISSGVEPGDKVVTNGQLRLVPGAKVLVKPTGEEPAKTRVESAQRGAPAEAHRHPERHSVGPNTRACFLVRDEPAEHGVTPRDRKRRRDFSSGMKRRPPKERRHSCRRPPAAPEAHQHLARRRCAVRPPGKFGAARAVGRRQECRRSLAVPQARTALPASVFPPAT